MILDLVGFISTHFQPKNEPRRPISGQMFTKVPTVYFDKDVIWGFLMIGT